MWNSQRVELGRPPSTPPLKRKSESHKKYDRPIPLRRPCNGSESLHSSSSMKRKSECLEKNDRRIPPNGSGTESLRSELKMDKEKKREKVRNLAEVTMESAKREVQLESAVVKRRRMTGHRFKSKFKRMREKEIIPEEVAPRQSKELLNYQGTEEQVRSVSSEKQPLTIIYPQRSLNTNDSARDHLAEEDNNQEISESNADEGRSLVPSIKLKNVKVKLDEESAKNVKVKLEEDSAKKEHNEGQQQNLAVKDKGAESEIGILMNKIQEKCDKRMNKLIREQQRQIQEFHQFWEEKRSQLEKDHKLESAITRSIYSEGSARTEKLKLMDHKFAKKMEENNILKNQQLKDLEMKQLVARDEEKQKEANWLAEAKACCSGEQRTVDGSWSLGSQSEEVGGCSESSTDVPNDKDIVPLTGQYVEDNNPSKIVQGNDVALTDKSVSALAEEVGSDVPTGNSSNSVSTNPQIEVGAAISERSMLAGVEQLNQPKNFGTAKITCVNLTPSTESIPGEKPPVELNKEVPPQVPETARNETDYANPVQMSNNTSNERFDEGDAIGLPDALVNQRDVSDGTTGGSPLEGQISEPSEKTKASTDNCALLPSKVLEDQIHQGCVSAVIQDQCAQVVEKQNTSPLEVAVSENVAGVTILLSNIELQDQNEPAIESQSTSPIDAATLETIDTITPEESNTELQDQDGPTIDGQSTSRIEVVPSDVINTVTPAESIENLQDQGAPVVEDQVTLQIVNAIDTITPEEVYTELQDQGAPTIDNQSTSRIEVAPSDVINTVTPEESIEKLQDQDAPVVEDQVTLQIEVSNPEVVDTVNPVQPNVVAPPIENCEELHLVSIHATPSCHRSLSVEVENQSYNLERNSSRTAEIAETETLPHESASQLGDNLELQSNHLVIGSENQVAHETRIEPSTSSLSNVSMSPVVASTVELPHQATLQLGVSVGQLCGYSYHFSHSNYQGASGNTSHLFAASLRNELEKICKETELLQRSHEDTMSQLKSDREKELQEIIAKYELKLQDAEAEFSSKKNGLDKNQKKVIMNILLAEAFSSSCLDFLSSGLQVQGMQQGIASSSVQHLHRLSPQHLVRPTSGATACQPAASQQITSQNFQAIQQLPQPHSMRLPVTSQNFVAPPGQAAQHAAALSFGTTSRPPVITGISSSNLRFGGEIRSSAPHLQPCRPGAASSVPTATFPSISHLQQRLFSQPSQSPPPAMPPPAAPQQPSTSQNWPQHQAVPPPAAPRQPSTSQAWPPYQAVPPPAAQRQPSISHTWPQNQAVPPPAASQQPSTSPTWPHRQAAPPAQWNPFLSTLESLMNVNHQPNITSNCISSCLPQVSSAFGSLEQSCLDALGNTQGNQTSSAIDAICLSDDD